MKAAPRAALALTILEAMDDPALFAPHLTRFRADRWRVFLQALFALPMDEASLEIYRYHTGRQQPPTEPFTEAALICGRRSGKSFTIALIATFLAVTRDYAPYLAVGEMATIAVLASDRRQARTIFRYVVGMLNAVPSLKRTIAKEMDESIQLRNNVVIEITTASLRATRGYTYAAVLADETAFWRSDESANPDAEILRALRPGMASIPGSVLLLASSPYAKRGELYAMFRRFYGDDTGRSLVWKAASLEMNPTLSQSIVDEAYASDPAAADAEYGGNFRNDVETFISREVVEACVEPGVHERGRMQGLRYVGFCDPSGGSSDSFTGAIAHSEGDKVVLDVIMERKPPFSPEEVIKLFSRVFKEYGIVKIKSDRYSGQFSAEQFQKNGIQCEQSARPKSELYGDMLPLLTSSKAVLLDSPVLVKQLCELERRTSRSGKDSIDHMPGSHDDVANFVAGSLLMASGKYDVTRLFQAYDNLPGIISGVSSQPYANRGRFFL